jgi:hypothetical protein
MWIVNCDGGPILWSFSSVVIMVNPTFADASPIKNLLIINSRMHRKNSFDTPYPAKPDLVSVFCHFFFFVTLFIWKTDICQMQGVFRKKKPCSNLKRILRYCKVFENKVTGNVEAKGSAT